jgi:predicted ATPase/transcriptional regulator with XRE-family HTH domain
MSEKRQQNKKLRIERLSQGWSQEEVAAQLGVDVRTVRRWESGQPVRPYNILGLTRLFKKSAEELGLIAEYAQESAETLNPVPVHHPMSSKILSTDSYNLPNRPFFSRSLTTHSHSLSIPATPLIGRENELTTIRQSLHRDEVRMLTLTGPGGTGKTRLGVQAALDLQETFADGVFFVDLAPIRDHTLVASTIARELGVQDVNGHPPFENLKAFLRQHHALLLLDNFEQVVDAALQMAELLATCPRIKLLITSREVLRVRAEHEFAVAPLALPERSRTTPMLDPTTLQNFPAVALFIERTRAIKPDFELTSTNSAAIVEICIRLDGLPLAIELAAAKGKLLQPQALLAHLNRRLDVVVRGLRDIPARQQTIYHSIAWSYDLLKPIEQRLFQRLSIFIGGCTLHAAEAVCIIPGEETTPLLDGVASLIDKSLLLPLKQEEHHDPRIMMLETIREYGLKCLDESGEAKIIQRMHAHYYLRLAEEAASKLAGADAISGLRSLEGEHQNLRLALHWALASGGEEIETALRLSSALWQFWRAHGHLSEGRKMLEQVLYASQTSAPLLRANLLNAAGVLAGLQGSYEQAETRCRESLIIYRELGNKQGSASSLSFLAQIATWTSDYIQAHILGDEALALFRELDDKLGIVATLGTLATAFLNEGDYLQTGVCAKESLEISRELGNGEGIARSLWLLAIGSFSQGDATKALTLLTESHIISKELDDKRGIADALVIMAYIAFLQGEFGRMHSLLEEALTLHSSVGDRRGIALGLYGQGWLALSQSQYGTAYSRFQESLSILVALGHQWFTILCIEGLAYTASLTAPPTQAVRLWGAANALREMIRAPAPPFLGLMYERMVAKLQSQLADEAFETAWAEGRDMKPAHLLEIK